MSIAMDKFITRVRVRDARGDDVKVTKIKEKGKEKEKEKENTCLLYMEMFPSKNLI